MSGCGPGVFRTCIRVLIEPEGENDFESRRGEPLSFVICLF